MIVLTANAVAGSRQIYLDAGFADYLTKPIDARLLEQTVKKFLPEWNLPAHAVYAGIASAKLLFNDRFLKKSLHES